MSAEIERRLQALEDEAAVRALVADYGPMVDSGRPEGVAGLWTDDGDYSYQADVAPLAGRSAIEAMVRSEQHQSIIASGSGHVLGPVAVRVDGDRAAATGYSMLVRRDPERRGWQVSRLSANRWECVRDDGRWRVRRRINRLLDGSADARALLAAVDRVAPHDEAPEQ